MTPRNRETGLCRFGSLYAAFDLEREAVFEPLENQVQQFVHRPASVVAGNLFVQMRPDTLDGVQVRRLLRQEVNHDPIAVLDQVVANRPFEFARSTCGRRRFQPAEIRAN